MISKEKSLLIKTKAPEWHFNHLTTNTNKHLRFEMKIFPLCFWTYLRGPAHLNTQRVGFLTSVWSMFTFSIYFKPVGVEFWVQLILLLFVDNPGDSIKKLIDEKQIVGY